MFLILLGGVGLWLEHNALLHAGALACSTLFSLAPTRSELLNGDSSGIRTTWLG